MEGEVAVVHDPLRGETFRAASGDGCELNGRALRVSEGTVKSTLYRARQILAPALGVEDPSEGVTHDARS